MKYRKDEPPLPQGWGCREGPLEGKIPKVVLQVASPLPLAFQAIGNQVAIAKEEGGEYILPSAETVNSGQYPIARELYMYSNGEPTGAVKDYLDWIMDAEAQQIVTDLGFVPIIAP